MAVYKRKFTPNKSSVTPHWWRLLVIPRYSFSDIFRSKLITAFFVGCFIYPLACVAIIYIRYNAKFLELFNMQVSDFAGWLSIDASFFLTYLYVQSSLSFLLTVFVGPGLISADLSNNALPLYLCRPFSRIDYILGKMLILLFLLSAVTWVPGLVLVTLQTSLAGLGWFADNLRLVAALVIGSWLWVVTLSLLSLAVSAWVRWKPVAAGVLFLIFFVVPGFGEMIDLMLRLEIGDLLNLTEIFLTIWAALFDVDSSTHLSLSAAWVALFSFCLISLGMLSRRLKAYEVIS